VRQQVHQGVVVDATLHHRVELDRRQAGAARVLDAIEHFGDSAESAAHFREHVRVERVEAHRDAIETRGLELAGVLGQQHAVGGERDVLDAVDRREVADEVRQVRAQQRLAASDADLPDAGAHEYTRELQQLGEVQTLAGFQEAVRVVEGFARHAVRAAEIATIHDRDAQVVDGPAQGVEGGAPLRERRQRHDFLGAHGIYQRKYRATKPLGKDCGPGGSSTNPSVPASAVKSPEPLVGRGSAEVRPQSSDFSFTGR
jgi:hypothetical protein